MLPHAGGNDLFVLYIFKCVSQDNLNVNAFRVKREYIYMLSPRQQDNTIMRHFNLPPDIYMVSTKKESQIKLLKLFSFDLLLLTQLVDDLSTGKVKIERIPEEINGINILASYFNGDTDNAWKQDFLSTGRFTEEEQNKLRDIRRRGKNKVNFQLELINEPCKLSSCQS